MNETSPNDLPPKNQLDHDRVYPVEFLVGKIFHLQRLSGKSAKVDFIGLDIGLIVWLSIA